MNDASIVMVCALAIGGPLAIVLAHVVCRAASRVICHWKDAELKMRLAEQGFSPQEIVMVVQAERPSAAHRQLKEAGKAKPHMAY